MRGAGKDNVVAIVTFDHWVWSSIAIGISADIGSLAIPSR
jgi:hypothetical protein